MGSSSASVRAPAAHDPRAAAPTPQVHVLRLDDRLDARRHRDDLMGHPLLLLRRLPRPRADRARLVDAGDHWGLLARAARDHDPLPAAGILARPLWSPRADDARLCVGDGAACGVVARGEFAGVLSHLGRDGVALALTL